MKPFLLFLGLVIGLNGLQAADKPMTAYQVLAEARKQLGASGKHLLSMESEHAKLRPRYWWIKFYDESLFLKLRAVQMIGPEMLQNVRPGNPFDGGDVDHVIMPDQLKFDSDKCVAFMEKAAKDSGIPLHSLNVRLEKPFPGESNPIWFFEWLDQNDDKIGTINVSATTGKVTEIVGLKIRDPRFKNVSKKTFSENVEDTFVGIGADLEEVFTGKRTVDKKTEDKESAGKPE